MNNVPNNQGNQQLNDPPKWGLCLGPWLGQPRRVTLNGLPNVCCPTCKAKGWEVRIIRGKVCPNDGTVCW